MALIFDGDVLLGSHIYFSNKIADSIRSAQRLGMYSTQFYMGCQRRYKRATITNNDIEETKQLLNKYPTHVFTHSPVTYNLAGSSEQKSLAWAGNSSVDDMINSLLKSLNYELDIISQFGGVGTVIHPGYCIPGTCNCQKDSEQAAIAAIATTLDMVTFKGKECILLEVCAGETNRIGSSLFQLAEIRSRTRNRENIAFCVDTAHIQGSGQYDLSTIQGVDNLFHDIDSLSETKQGEVKLFHLNDSQVKLNSKRDRHAGMMTGTIWGDDYTSLLYLLSKIKDRKIPVVMETSYADMYVMNRLLDYNKI
jgi:apurinic endonuclease APN1